MIDFKYYTHGIENTDIPVYALYQPVLDCFLFVTNYVDIAEEIVRIMSSRYNLFVCNISSANNYTDDIIDNSCCENWSLSNKHNIKSANIHQQLTVVGELCESVRAVDHDIKKEKQWIFLCNRWLTELSWLRPTNSHTSAWTIKVLNLGHLSSVVTNFTELENKVLRLLYLNTDVVETNAEIEVLMAKFRQLL